MSAAAPTQVGGTPFRLAEERTANGGVSLDYFRMISPEMVTVANTVQTGFRFILTGTSPREVTLANESSVRTLEKDFNKLSKEWKSDTAGPQSSLSRILTHPAYLAIISYGERMIPYILRDLQMEPNHWFTALKIMNHNKSPVRPEDAGNIKKMTEAWLRWGRENGKLP